MELITQFKKSKQSVIGIAILFFVVVFIIFSVSNFYISVKINQTRSSDVRLMDFAKSNISSTNIFFEGQQAALKGIALSLEDYPDLTANEVISFLDSAAKKLSYERLAIDFLDGSSYTSDGHIFDVTSMGFIDKVKNGENFITDVILALADQSPVVCIFTPIYKNGVPVASLRCALKTEDIAEKIASRFFDGKGYFYLIDGTGNYVADSSSTEGQLMSDNFFDEMKKIEYEEDYSCEKFMEDLKVEKEGYTKYSYGGEQRYAYYVPMGINDWVMMTIVPRGVVEKLISSALTNTIILLLEILLSLFALFGYIFWVQRRASRKALLDEKCFRVLSKQSGNIIFEWDFSNGKITSMSNFESVFGREPFTNTSENEAILASAIHPCDIEIFSTVFHNVLAGKNVMDVKFRIRNIVGEFVWCSLSGVVINDSRNKPYKAIGSMKNIDAEEKETQALKDKAQKDLLTDLYNKISTEIFVSEYVEKNIQTGVEGALFMIDLDNFKGVNDNLGHQFGDKVLSDAADKLKKIFRISDIIGRVGGDEFIVFMKGILDVNIVKERAREICAAFNQTFLGEEMEYRVSASIGIALFPQHGHTFHDLYKLADLALYQAKRNGKNGFTFYNHSIAEDERQDVILIENAERFIASYFAGDPFYTIFEMLYETKDIRTTINVVLGIIGKRYQVDRCYIFEVSEDGTLLSNTYEWCAPATTPEIDSLQNIPIENMSGFFSNYNEDGLFYCNDLSTLDQFSYETLLRQGIKSLLHCAIFDKNIIRGFIGFDECKIKRVWSGEEIANLGYISRILSIFILKRQMSRELLESYHNYTQILDNMNGYVYVIDPNTFNTLYINSAVKAFGASHGEKCYKIAFFSDTPCKNCPVKNLGPNTNFATEDIYSIRANTWVNAVASKLKWAGGTDAALVYCTDITKYKTEGEEECKK